jgi:uncharacterized membrane protein
MEEAHLLARVRRVLIAGLVVLVPAALTLATLVWLFRALDGVLGPSIAELVGRQIPGLGLVATVTIVAILGLVSRNVIGNRLVRAAESLVQGVPIARSLYSSTKGVLATLADRPADAFKRVVLLEYPRRNIWSVGFVTGSIKRRADAPPSGDLLTIFVPTTPNPTSGFLVLVPRAETTELRIPVEEGVRLVISGGILRPASWAEPSIATELG